MLKSEKVLVFLLYSTPPCLFIGRTGMSEKQILAFCQLLLVSVIHSQRASGISFNTMSLQSMTV